MRDNSDGVTATVKRLIIMCNDNKPVFRVKLHFITQVLCIRRLRCHSSQPFTGPSFLILNLIVLDVVTVRLLWRQQLDTKATEIT